ncbi:MAG: AI-2E family transporter [Halosimplex sp.]
MVEFEFNPDWGRMGWVSLGTVLALALLWVFYSFVGTFVFALFIYYSTRRVHGHVRYRVGQPSVSAALALVVLALPAVLLLLYATAIGVQQFQQFAGSTDVHRYIEIAGPYFNVSQTVEDPGRLLDDANAMDLIRQGLNQGTAYLGFLATGLLHLFIMFAVAFYLLRDDHRLAEYVRNYEDGGVFEAFAREVDDSLELIFAGNILNAVVTGTVGAITYSVLNVFAPPEVAIPYAALVGLLTGIASLVPVVGMKLVYVPVTAYLAVLAFAAGSGWGFVFVFAAVSFVVVDIVPDLLVRPYVTGGTLHTGSVMFAYILGSLLFGWYGLFLGPILLVLVTHFGRIVVPEILASRRTETPTGGATEAVPDESAASTPAPSGGALDEPPATGANPGGGATDTDEPGGGEPTRGETSERETGGNAREGEDGER